MRSLVITEPGIILFPTGSIPIPPAFSANVGGLIICKAITAGSPVQVVSGLLKFDSGVVEEIGAYFSDYQPVFGNGPHTPVGGDACLCGIFKAKRAIESTTLRVIAVLADQSQRSADFQFRFD